MIERLQRRMTLLVFAVILIISAGTVLSINLVNYGAMRRQAMSTLSGLIAEESPGDGAETGNNHSEEAGPSGRAKKPGGDAQPGEWQDHRQYSQQHGKGQPYSIGKDAEQLSNTYRIRLDTSGNITWQSSRADLYTDEQVKELAGEIQNSGKTSGIIGTQYFMVAERGNYEKVIAVLDARLELQSLRRVLVITSVVALISGLILGLGAFWLIRRMIRPVKEGFERQRRFVSDASHEMKTPLAIISANAQVLESEIGQNESLSCIRSEVDRTAGLVRNLLTLAHAERGEKKPDAEIGLSQEIEGAVLAFESVAFEAGRPLESSIEKDLRIKGAGQDIRQIMDVLLDNALKYGEEKTPIRVELKQIRREAVLSVENAAEEIPGEELPRLFERFYRGDQAHSRTKDGTGLGLAIARELTESLNGKIRAESSQHTVRLTVSFPLLNAGTKEKNHARY